MNQIVLRDQNGNEKIVYQSPIIEHEPIPDGWERYCCVEGMWSGHDALCGGCGKYIDKPINNTRRIWES